MIIYITIATELRWFSALFDSCYWTENTHHVCGLTMVGLTYYGNINHHHYRFGAL